MILDVLKLSVGAFSKPSLVTDIDFIFVSDFTEVNFLGSVTLNLPRNGKSDNFNRC